MYFTNGNSTVPLNVAILANKQNEKEIKIQKSQTNVIEDSCTKDTPKSTLFSGLFKRVVTLAPQSVSSAQTKEKPEDENFTDFF